MFFSLQCNELKKKKVIKNCSNNIVFENEDEKGKRGERQKFSPLIRLT